MKMRSIALVVGTFFGAVALAGGQAQRDLPATAGGDTAITYHWVRTNAQPGQCGCFDLNGGGVSGSWKLGSRFAAVAAVGAEYAGQVPSTGNSLTLVTYLGGGRYFVPQPWLQGQHAPQAFLQVLVGAGHAGGGIAGAGDSGTAFVSRMGGGVDVPVTAAFALRVVQVDYDLTTFANSTDNHQNNLLVGAGVVYRWSRGR
jgi:outer membrane immunogenic protein